MKPGFIQRLPKLSKKKWIALIVVTIIVVSCVFVMFSNRSTKNDMPIVRTAKVREQNLSVKVFASGNLKPANEMSFYSKSVSTVKEILKEEGAYVTKGEPLLLLDDSEALRNLGQAESNLSLLEAEYGQKVISRKYWIANVDEAKKNVVRMEKLFEIGAISLKDLDNSKMDLLNAESQLAGIDLKAIQDNIEKSRLEVQAAREVLTATTITSPFDGTVLKIGIKEGNPVSIGAFIVSIGDISRMEAHCSINEYDALKLKVGQAAEVYSEGMRDKKYKGHVSFVAPLAELENTSMGSENKVKIRIALDEELKELKPGFSISTNVLIDERKQVPTVPIEAITSRDGKDVIFVYKDGQAEMREIEKGIANELYQEVITGVKNGEVVIVSSLEGLKNQTKVKVNDQYKKPN